MLVDDRSDNARGSAERWTLTLGQEIELRSAGGTRVRLPRKTAALLCLLGVSGPSRRDSLAERLWSDARDARGSLRQALHQLRRSGSIVEGGDQLALSSSVEVVEGHGELLSSLDLDDMPDVAEWAAHERERRRVAALEALSAQAADLEREGRLADALRVAREAHLLEPLSESACRTVMRLAYLDGDRASALSTYRTFERRLADELQLRPLPETNALAKDIERASIHQRYETHAEIPVTVDRPPTLAGREAEWRQMEDAWENGQVIYLSGPPGVGKTRLMRDFAASKVPRERWNVFTARPGDGTAPYASQARAFRAVLDACPGIELTPPMRRELSRLLPDLADRTPPAMTSLEEKNYFYATLAEVLILSGAWLDCWVADDWQFIDAESLEMANYMFANVTPVATDRKGQRAICTFRTEEVGDDFRAFLADLVRGGIAVHIELPPLDTSSVARLLDSTRVEGAAALAERMHDFTGGNPLFIVETLKSLLESDSEGLARASLRDHLPRRVAHVFEERFRRLSPSELRLIRLVALAQTDATAEVAAIALDATEADVVSAQSRLEAARLLDGFSFGHDLVYEAAVRGIPEALRAYLHRRVAAALVEVQGPAARIAYHLERGGDGRRALPYLLEAAEDARVQGAFGAASVWYERVRDRDEDARRVALAQAGLEALGRLSEGS